MRPLSSGKLKILSVFLLVLSSLIWGSAFVAQRVGLDHVGPLTFTFARNVLAVIALCPLILLRVGEVPEREKAAGERRQLWLGGILVGVLLTIAMNLQQTGLLYTTPGKAGFITAFYIVLVPVFLFLGGRRISFLIWIAAALAVAGLYLLSVSSALEIGLGEILCFACAIVYSFHIMTIERVAPRVNIIRLAAIQFGTCAVLTGILMLIFERPDWSSLLPAWQALVFAGVLSSAVGYTLQIFGQRHLSAPVASLLMSLESVFAVLADWFLLGQRLSARDAAGSVLMLAGVLLSQWPERRAVPVAREKAE